ncbi:MAG: glycosyltransferase, partial [Desulfobacteraceae bacterium]|nr:glycosyltransferase [Desulfobacteraceae bacterium]
HHIAWLRPLNRMIVQFQVWLVCRILHIRNPVVLAACPAACEMAINMEKSRLVYQRTDRFEEYPNVDAETIRRYDRKLKATADLTVFVSSSLYEEERKQCKKALFVDQGVNYDMFASAEKNEDIPREMLKVERPIVGFFGGIDDHTSDIRFVEKVIELLPQMSFVFVGQASLDVTGLQKKNVWMLGQKPYEEIPHYGKCFDVAIMVWRQNHWIQACNPIKLKEYLALGKPIVSTPFPELDKYLDVVYKAETPEQFAESIESALAEDSPGRIMARREKVRGASWKKTAQLVRKELFENEQTEQDIGKSE